MLLSKHMWMEAFLIATGVVCSVSDSVEKHRHLRSGNGGAVPSRVAPPPRKRTVCDPAGLMREKKRKVSDEMGSERLMVSWTKRTAARFN